MPERYSSGRFATACIFSPLAAVAVVEIWFLASTPPESWLRMTVPVALFGYQVAFLHLLFLGLPLYGVLRLRWRLGWGNAALVGAIAGTVPITLLTAGSGGIVELVSALAAACGAAAGLAFRAVLGHDIRD